MHKKIGKENLNWKVIESQIFSLKKSNVTKRHIDVIEVFWKKRKASVSAENVYATTANIQASGQCDSIKEHQKAELRIEINEQHPELIQDLQRTPEKQPSNNPPGTSSLLENVGSLVETMSILTNATLSEDGYYLKKFNEKTFIIPLPKSWRNDIILSENGKRMYQNFLDRAISLVENHNESCCYKFRVNRFKRDNSRKHRLPIWSAIISCTFDDCKSKASLSIDSEFDNHITVTFDGQIKHAMSEVRRRKVSGDERESMKNILKVSKEAPSKIYRDSLANMSDAQYASGKRGHSSQAISNMKAEAKSVLNTQELLSDLLNLREAIKSEDERIAIEDILKRKFFGYIHFLNVADEVNIICFTEGSLKWHRECFNRN